MDIKCIASQLINNAIHIHHHLPVLCDADVNQLIRDMAAPGEQDRVTDCMLNGLTRTAPCLHAKTLDDVPPEFFNIGFGVGKEYCFHVSFA